MLTLRTALSAGLKAAPVLGIYPLLLAGYAELQAQTAQAPKLETGEQIYKAACVSCHGPEGRAMPRTTVGFETKLPDFTDCAFATKEPDGDWSATIHNGGPARGLSRIMPSFREALSDEQIDQVIGYLRGFCKDKRWPLGDFNLPRPMVTEKAFPESELVLTTAVNAKGAPGVSNVIVYEQRIGAIDQLELTIPYNFIHPSTAWQSGLGDVSLGWKHVLFHSIKSGTIFSAVGEVTAPTGSTSNGLGGGSTIFEGFIAAAQILPANFFVQFQGGTEQPAHTNLVPRAAYARTAVGWSWSAGEGYGRTWTPMTEFIADRDFKTGAVTNWDAIPQLQIPLSKKMHILAGIGTRIPINNTVGRPIQPMVYLLWDFADGGLKEGW